MAIPSWPGTLPQIPLQNNYHELPPNLVQRTQMDKGLAKVRQRFTGGPRTININMLMTTAQVATFDAFLLANMATTWTFNDARTGANMTTRFVIANGQKAADYDGTEGGGAYWMVAFIIEYTP